MGLPRAVKLAFVGEVLDKLSRAFSVVTLREHANLVASRPALPVLNPSFLQ
jgi:hypothetical protein